MVNLLAKKLISWLKDKVRLNGLRVKDARINSLAGENEIALLLWGLD